MAFRIYILAKELDIDSKELVDLCPKAGVLGKGSALASLTDEEVEKLRSFVRNRGRVAVAEPPQRPVAAAAASTATAKLAKAGADTAVVAAPPAATTPPPMRREDYIAPGGVAGKPPVIGTRPSDKPPIDVKKKNVGSEPKPKPPVVRTPPSIKLAPMPEAPTPTAPAANEPAPQKPDLRLPPDAIRAGRAGTKPLQEHLRKQEQRRRTDGEPAAPRTGGRPAAGAPPAAPPMLPGAGGRDRNRRGAKTGAGAGAAKGPDEFNSALGGREQRQLKRKRVGGDRRGRDDDDGGGGRRTIRRTGVNTAAPRKTKVVVELPCTVRSFSEELGIPVSRVLSKLLALGTMGNINAALDLQMAELLALELGIEAEFREAQTEDRMLAALSDEPDDPADLVPRAPVVTFLGHVDHGKTSLLDRIIGINVAAGESGGITQHIRAYRVDWHGRPIAFVDTPGHEAFTEMRARGANVTDIAVLVVAADDGVMPQTEEAISHARAANVPIVVALNKIDLPGIDENRILQQLAANNLLATEWGGDVEIVRCSALKGTGIDELLETLLTIADLHELKANPNRPAVGTCLEASLDEGRGVVAKFMVQKGTLRVGDVLVCGTAYGRVKTMYDTLRPTVTYDEAGPATPVNLTGLDEAPAAGQHFYVLDDISQARDIASQRGEQQRQAALSGGPKHVTLESLFDRLGGEQSQTLNLILRADVRGSIEAILKELTKLEHPEVQIRVLQATVGGVSEADVHLADASDAVIIAFNVVPDESARLLADNRGVQIRRYEIIYQVTQDLKAALEGMLKPERREAELGRVLVLRLFPISRVGTICGCRVLSGTVERGSRARVIRDSRIIGEYPLESLRREKDDVKEVREGYECGIRLAGFNDVKEGDVLEVYKFEEVARTLDS